jgi:hypothetical protein
MVLHGAAWFCPRCDTEPYAQQEARIESPATMHRPECPAAQFDKDMAEGGRPKRPVCHCFD